MDGYAAFGASITYRGSKQTFNCPAPELVVADLDILCAAPPELSAAGYGDLLAKLPAGADWLLADALGVEPLHPEAWQLAQGSLSAALSNPEGVRRGESALIRRLMEGLLSSGLSMQLTHTSRPASGAEHQFSHLWDMQGHTHQGETPYHGFKVGIGTLAITRLYEALLECPLETLNMAAVCAQAPSAEETEAELTALFPEPHLLAKAREETAAKQPCPEELRAHLERVRAVWPTLRQRVLAQLPASEELARRLVAVGAPTRSEEIGISPERLRASYRLAYSLRRRYTVLDLAMRTGLLEPCLNSLFRQGGTAG
jgi:glycerol-1-phosphate dehydrogenase [NAD(P)+]